MSHDDTAQGGAWRRRAVALVLVALSVLWVAQSNDFGPSTMAALLPRNAAQDKEP